MGRSYGTAIGTVVVCYLAVAFSVYLWRGVFFTPDPPDSWEAVLFVSAIVLGRWKSFLREWLPFVVLIFGYEILRGFAGTVAVGGQLVPANPGSVHFQFLLDADTWLGFGQPLTVRLQSRFFTPGTSAWYDLLAGLIYSLHFALPVLFAFVLWLRNIEWFRRFVLTLLVVTYSTFIVFLLVPTAPPWLVGAWGKLAGVQDPFNQTGGLTHSTALSTLTVWTKASPDPVAAFPSLHAAYPWLVMLFVVRFFGRRGWFMLVYNAAVWLTIVYLAQHWVIDAIAGMLWATSWFLIMDKWLLGPRGPRWLREMVISSPRAP